MSAVESTSANEAVELHEVQYIIYSARRMLRILVEVKGGGCLTPLDVVADSGGGVWRRTLFGVFPTIS